MRILWLCSLPLAVQQQMLGGEDHGAQVAMSWILAHLPPPPGVELHVACLWQGGTRRKTVEFGGVPFHLVPCPRRGRALTFFQRDAGFFRPVFAELQPDIVHGWGTEDSFGLVARRLAPRRHVIGIQGLITAYRRRIPMHPRTMLTEVTERLTLRSARQVVAESGYSLREARPLAPRAEMSVIEHPLRAEFLQATPSDGTARRILFIGNVEERKGIGDAVRAFAQLGDSGWHLHVIGHGSDEADLAALVDSLGIRSRFTHDRALPVGAVVAAMQQSAIFLLPTRIDTGPTALKEALTMGLWPVCYDNSGPAEYIGLFQFGALARDLDEADLAATLQRAITARPWEDAEARARLRAATRIAFAREEIWPKLLALYREIDARARTSGDSGSGVTAPRPR